MWILNLIISTPYYTGRLCWQFLQLFCRLTNTVHLHSTRSVVDELSYGKVPYEAMEDNDKTKLVCLLGIIGAAADLLEKEEKHNELCFNVLFL